MRVLIPLSLLVNVLVLVPVVSGLATNARWACEAYGDPSPARGILLAVYGAITVCSALLLVSREPRAVAVLLLVQVLYKLATPFTVGRIAHPVVLSNLAIAALHITTLFAIWRTTRDA